MYLTFILFYSFQLNSVWLHSPVPLFTGEQTLESFILLNYCSPRHTNSGESLIIIDNFQKMGSNNLSKSLFLNSFIKCSFSRLHLSNLLDHLPVNTYFNTVNIQLIFDLQTHSNWNESIFVSLLKSFSEIYSKCLSCKPFLLLFAEPIFSLENLTLRALKHLPNNFHSILLSSISTEIIYINLILYGCYQYRGIFKPNSKAQYDLLKMSYKKCNLQSTILNVSVNHWIPFCNLNRDAYGKVSLLRSMDGELLKQLEKRYNFRSNFIDGQHMRGQLINGTWNGVVGQVLYGKSNLAICGIMNSPQRQLAVDFSKYLFMDEVTFISQNPPRIYRRQWIVVKSFSRSVWILFALNFAVLTLTLKFATRQSYQKILLRLFGIAIKQTIGKLHRESNSTARLVYCTWLCAALFFTITYCSSFYSLLTASKRARPVDTLQDIERAARSDTHYIIALNNSIYISQFTESVPENQLFYTIGQHINRTKRKVLTHPDEQIASVRRDPKNLLIASRTYLTDEQRKARLNRLLHIGSENLNFYYTGLALPKRSPLLRPFNKIIDQFQDAGLFHFWTRHYGRRRESRRSYKYKLERKLIRSMRELTFDELGSIFRFYWSALVLACICFVLEVWRFVWAVSVQRIVE